MHTVRLDETLCGRYRLKARLGEGGMGTVYVADDLELHREVAVKLLAAPLMHQAEVVERFEREARLTAKLDHPNLVPIYDVGRHHGRPFMVMKKLEGSTLAALLRRDGGLSPDQTLALLRQLAAGVDYLHGKGFIHRDIKAANIFVSSERHVTLLDFGILRPSGASEALTKTGVVMGTPHYMAPEQALGLKHLDHRADLYALAVVVFECLSGTLPFEADSELEVIQLQAHASPPDLLQRAPWISKPLAEVIRRALAKRPEDRFATAAELLKALETAATSATPQAPATYQGAAAPSGTAPSWRRQAGGDAEPPAASAASRAQPASPVLPAPAAAKARHRAPLVLAPVVVLALASAGALALRPRPGPTAAATADAGAATQTAVAGAIFDAGLAADLDAARDAGRRALTSPAQPPAKRGSVNVVAVHDGEMFWGEVFLDGVEKGRTPLTLELAPGRYQLRIERHGFKPQERQIIVASGRSIVERFDLAP